jgi:hypothetical protein
MVIGGTREWLKPDALSFAHHQLKLVAKKQIRNGLGGH